MYRRGGKVFFTGTAQFVDSDVFRSLHDEVILIKGSRMFGFDRITELLELKVHETILEVNLNAVVANLNFYRSFMRRDKTGVHGKGRCLRHRLCGGG